MTLKEIREKQARLTAEARERLAEIKDDTPEARAKELNDQHDLAMAEYDRLEERAKKLEALDAADAALGQVDERRRPNGEGEQRQVHDANETPEQAYGRIFRSWLMSGVEGLAPEERAVLRRGFTKDTEARAQSAGTSTAGGYLIPQDFMAELIVSLKAYGSMTDASIIREIVTATGAELPWPTMDDTSNTGRRIAENTQVTTTNLSFGAKRLGAFKYTTDAILVSSELEQDSALPVEGIVRDAMAERLGRILNTELTTGTGGGMPSGIVTAAGAGATAAGATAIVFDDMINLYHSVDPAYRNAPGVRWMFNDSVLKMLRKLKDGQNQYIWQPASVAASVPATILDKPYSINQAMADVATTNRTVLFGDMKRYVVRRVKDFALKRLVERYADYDQVGYIGFARYDGLLTDAGAVKALTQA